MPKTLVQMLKDGPILVKGEFELKDAEGKAIAVKGDEAHLCRCGASKNKPFCDGSHHKVNFKG